jgi:hypothetical protein
VTDEAPGHRPAPAVALLGRPVDRAQPGVRLALSEAQARQLHGVAGEFGSLCWPRQVAPRPLLRWTLYVLGLEVQLDDRALWSQTAAFVARAAARPFTAPWREGSGTEVVQAAALLAAALHDTAIHVLEPAAVAAVEARFPDLPYRDLHAFLKAELAKREDTSH